MLFRSTFDFATNGYTVAVYLRLAASQVATAAPRYGVCMQHQHYYEFGVCLTADAAAFEVVSHAGASLGTFGTATAGAWTCVMLRVAAAGGAVECVQDGVVVAQPSAEGALHDGVQGGQFSLGGTPTSTPALPSFSGDVRAAAWYEGAVSDADMATLQATLTALDRKSTRLNSSHVSESRMPSSA